MAKFSKVNLRNKVVMVDEFDHIEQAEHMHGGNWIEYQLQSSKGIVGSTYDPTLDIFKEPLPTDVYGKPCNSWTLDNSTGKYVPPKTKPTITKEEDDKGQNYYWDELNNEWILYIK